MQAETCFKAYLEVSERYNLLASNIQIQGEERTLGELDYLVYDNKLNKNIHIELACKFYLFDTTTEGNSEEKWIGPNRKDTLFDKLEKLKNKQFPLLFTSEGKRKLENLKIEFPIEQQLCLKASLFLPKKIESIKLPSNYEKCVTGHWIYEKELNTVADQNAKYAIPNKKEWLLPIEEITEWFSFTEIKLKIEEQLQSKKSPLIYKKADLRMERFFVVWW